MKRFTLFGKISNDLLYLAISLGVLLYMLGISPKAFIAWILSYVFALVLEKVFSKVNKTDEDKSRSSWISLIIIWGGLTYLFKWGAFWYISGAIIYIVVRIIYIFLAALSLNRLKKLPNAIKSSFSTCSQEQKESFTKVKNSFVDLKKSASDIVNH